MIAERLSDKAIEIIDGLHRERLDYNGEYIPLIDAANKLCSYEDTGLDPAEVVKMGVMFEDSKRYSGRLELKLRAAKELAPKWIPVTEQLPKDRGDVLAVVFWHETWRVKMARCIPERNEWYVHVGFADRNDVLVSHWMPLPVPPDRRSPKGESDA